jgi:carbonic anhydrase
MEKLIAGVHHFQEEIFSSKRELFERLSKGQQPETLFITCSDSRINPNLITHTAPGDLFILRNAGNIVPPYGSVQGGEAATIEFAVAHLNVRDIIICGHLACGAVKGLFSLEAVSEEMPAVGSWLKYCESVRRIIKENYSHVKDPDKLTNIAAQENVLLQLEHLRTHPSVAARLQNKRINLHGWMYKIQTGEIFMYKPELGQFLPLGESAPVVTRERELAEI